MKPTLEQLQALCPDVPGPLARAHWERLDARYFTRFPLEIVCRHLQGLARLSPENPIEILWDEKSDGRLDCTILAFDYTYEFSLIAGVMAGLGYNILSGGIHTYARAVTEAPGRRIRRPRWAPVAVDPMARRRIVDHFSGRVESDLALDAWKALFQERLMGVIRLLESGEEQTVANAKSRVNEWVAQRLSSLHLDSQPVLYPVQIEIDNQAGPFTRLSVVSEDTPAFLYAFSNALSLRGISIEHIKIETRDRRIEDIIDFVDPRGEQITDIEMLNQVRFSLLLTKQFTYFLGQSPDPFTALVRFENLVEDAIRLPESGKWVDLLSNPRILQDLARILGASDFLWEDLFRQQYETLLPMLAPHVGGHELAHPLETLPERLAQVLEEAATLEEKKRRLNHFKDEEIYLIDMDNILGKAYFRELANHLTFLAEQIVRQSVRLLYDHLAGRYGRPRTVAGLEARYAVLGLGKFGGAALGYASDIELMLVYGDNGTTDGPEPVSNREFFEMLVDALRQFILAKREGIFNIDLRLRPYGNDGPLACSLETFCDYYGPGGAAHALERLALVRLRAVAGDRELGSRLERLRDEFVYAGAAIAIPDLREMRWRQWEEKTAGRLNAKFSPGGLVDVEYDVQILQVLYGKDHPQLRTPRIHQALKGLREAGVLGAEESEELIRSYDFLRDLINGLRMLRGNAQDLFLPGLGSGEYSHLARRLGYSRRDGMDPARQLHLEFEARTAAVRAFVERHFGRESLPGPAGGTVADLILSDAVAPGLRDKILLEAGFQNPERAYVNLRALAGESRQPERRNRMAKLAILAVDTLRRMPDPDMALNNWERFVQVLPDPQQHFALLMSQPMRLELLLAIFSNSQFLADSLARNPEFLEWATDPKNLGRVRTRAEHELELREKGDKLDPAGWMDMIRRYRRREFLRIGTRDICLKASLADITRDLSELADALIGMACEQAWLGLAQDQPGSAPAGFGILAFGKLGGQELNYSSDIDLVAVYDDRGQAAPGSALYHRAMESVQALLSRYTGEGYVYRVDLRLRPYGIGGQLVVPLSGLVRYYQEEAATSEVQSLLKMRPVAGNLDLGREFLEQVRPILLRARNREAIVASIERVRGIAMERVRGVQDVKSGFGGIRDIEFLVQGLQMIHGHAHPEILNGNTLDSLSLLAKAGLLPPLALSPLAEAYIFLRRVEHYLQILEDRQIHALPEDGAALEALAKRMLGSEAGKDAFIAGLQAMLATVRETYTQYLLEA